MPSYQQVVRKVKRGIGRRAYDSLHSYVAAAKPILWGSHQPRNYLEVMLNVTLYHDMFAKGWQKCEEITGVAFNLPHNTLDHNAKVLRKLGKDWASLQIEPGSYDEWKAAARGAAFGKAVSEATLLIDSTDLPLQRRKRKREGDSKYWSAKLKRPGWRFTAIIDASKRARYLSMGYSPKLYDGHFIEARRDIIEKDFERGVFVGDSHYEAGKDFRGVTFLTPKHRGPSADDSSDEEELAQLTKVEESYNAAHKRAQKRIEHLWRSVKGTWRCFRQPWAGTTNQLSYAMQIAVAAHNLKI